MLWFAWKLVLLQYRKQQNILDDIPRISCDLLENSYFCSIANNLIKYYPKGIALWFAWKLVLLQYRKQLSSNLSNFSISCDLLENSYFCSIANNLWFAPVTLFVLWFAWKLVLLQYRKQLSQLSAIIINSCDLLENSYFCSIANNRLVFVLFKLVVVICLKTRTFAVSQTTVARFTTYGLTLWFAWKLVLLQYRKQPICHILNHRKSCDLLENSYFCSIANNLLAYSYSSVTVVICLKTRTFAVSQTTFLWSTAFCLLLWFAWKLVLLQYRKQHHLNQIFVRLGCDLLENSYFCSIANNIGHVRTS